MNSEVSQNTVLVGMSLIIALTNIIPLEFAVIMIGFFSFDLLTGTIKAYYKKTFRFDSLLVGILKKIATYSLLIGFVLLEALAKNTANYYQGFELLNVVASILPIKFASIFCIWALCLNDLLSGMCNIREILGGHTCKQKNIIYYLQIPVAKALCALLGIELKHEEEQKEETKESEEKGQKYEVNNIFKNTDK